MTTSLSKSSRKLIDKIKTAKESGDKVTMKTISDKVAARLDKQDELAKFNRHTPIKKAKHQKDNRSDEQKARAKTRKRMEELIERRKLAMEIDWL